MVIWSKIWDILLKGRVETIFSNSVTCKGYLLTAEWLPIAHSPGSFWHYWAFHYSDRLLWFITGSRPRMQKKSKAVQSMIRLMMTGFTWKLRVCFAKDVKGGEPTTCWIGTSEVNTHRGTFRNCILSCGNVHPHSSDRNKSVLRRLFLEVLTSFSCLGFAGKKGVKLGPLSNLEALPKHLAFCGKFNTQIQKHDFQNCTSEPWFRDAEVNQKLSTLFPVDPNYCPVI